MIDQIFSMADFSTAGFYNGLTEGLSGVPDFQKFNPGLVKDGIGIRNDAAPSDPGTAVVNPVKVR